jgi:hypothetical protein
VFLVHPAVAVGTTLHESNHDGRPHENFLTAVLSLATIGLAVRGLLSLVAVAVVLVLVRHAAKVVVASPLRRLRRCSVLLLGVVRVIVRLLRVVIVVVRGAVGLGRLPVAVAVAATVHLGLHLDGLLRLLLTLRLLRRLSSPVRRLLGLLGLLGLLPLLLLLIAPAVSTVLLRLHLRLLRLLHLLLVHLSLLLEGTKRGLTDVRFVLRARRLVVPRGGLCLCLGVKRCAETASKVVSTADAERVTELEVHSVQTVGIRLRCPSDVTLSSTW